MKTKTIELPKTATHDRLTLAMKESESSRVLLRSDDFYVDLLMDGGAEARTDCRCVGMVPADEE